MIKYICSICGYIYNPVFGDPAFEIYNEEDNLDEWVCPRCGCSKSNFKIDA